jgi:hypothetical protein
MSSSVLDLPACRISSDYSLHSCGNAFSKEAVHWRMPFPGTASQLYLHGKTKARQWRYRCKRLSSLSVVRYILAANQWDSEAFTLKKETICFSEMSVLTRATRHHHIPEDSILHCYCREQARSYTGGAMFYVPKIRHILSYYYYYYYYYLYPAVLWQQCTGATAKK